jgi:RNA polymerase sigma factor (sigma-70 family)
MGRNPDRPSPELFRQFARDVERPLRYALVAELGPDRGRDAVQDALVYAWEHWDQLADVQNRPGYLYRIAKRRAMRQRFLPLRAVVDPPLAERFTAEPGLGLALARLTGRQRAVVYLVEGLGMTQRETAALLGISRSSIQTHLERGLATLRAAMGVTDAV